MPCLRSRHSRRTNRPAIAGMERRRLNPRAISAFSSIHDKKVENLSALRHYMGNASRKGYSMTAAETEKLAHMLRQKLEELGRSRHHRDDIVIEKVADALDEVQLMGERELAIRCLDRDSKMLLQIRFALSRIADDAFGVCLHCEEAISAKRMAALPWATYCIKCQERVDRREIEVSESLELAFAD